jgi:hypothetical protein
MTHRATVTWRKRNAFRKIGTQENCGPRKEFATAGIRMITVQKWHGLGEASSERIVPGPRLSEQVEPLRKNLRKHHVGKCGTKDLVGKQLPYMSKKRATVIGIGGWSSKQLSPLGRRVSVYEVLKKTLELEFVKRARRMSAGFVK